MDKFSFLINFRTVHSTQYTVHSTQYTVHSTQYTVHSTQYTVHSTQYTVHSTQYTVHSTQYTVHSTQYTVHSTQYTVHSTQYTVHSTQYTVHSTQYTVHSTQYTVHSTQYTVHSTQYTVHSTQYTVHSTQYTVHSTQYSTVQYSLCGGHPCKKPWDFPPAKHAFLLLFATSGDFCTFGVNVVHKLASGTLKPKNSKKYPQSKNEAHPHFAYILRTCCVVVAYLGFFFSGVPVSQKNSLKGVEYVILFHVK